MKWKANYLLSTNLGVYSCGNITVPFCSWGILRPHLCELLGCLAGAHVCSWCSSWQSADWLVPADVFFSWQIIIHVFPKVQHFCKGQILSGWETSIFLCVLLAFQHVSVRFCRKLTWSKCPALSWGLQMEGVVWNQNCCGIIRAKAPEERLCEGGWDGGSGESWKLWLLAGERSPDSPLLLPLTSVITILLCFCTSLPEGSAFNLLFLAEVLRELPQLCSLLG